MTTLLKTQPIVLTSDPVGEAGPMKAYRLYVLNPHEHVFEALEGQYADDFAALEDAEAMRADRFAVEVWNGERLVGRVGGEFSL